MPHQQLTAERLRECLHYDINTGVFTRRTGGRGFRKGDIACDTGHKRYVRVCVDGRKHYAHRLAVLYVTGAFPEHDVDHIDGDTRNNKFSNLRCVCRSVNNHNLKRAKSHNRCGLLGVKKMRGSRYLARITVRGEEISLGGYATPEAAHQAYIAAKRQLHEGNTL